MARRERKGGMMREILFKAKRKDNGEWVEGYYLNVAKINHFICTGKIKLNGAVKGILAPEMYAIDPDTLCQFTGFTDKNGKKIWENDIVDTFEESSKEFLRNVVKFEDGCFKVFKKHYLSMHMDSYEKTDLKVVGNIFDNPDLLEME